MGEHHGEEQLDFVVNGKNVQVLPSTIPSTLSLARFLRDHLFLKGTKIMCNQAGCGTCVVTAVVPDGTDNGKTISINSCVTPVLSCQGWNITTVEGIGNPKTGLNPIQKRMMAYDASQCGFCTSGMIMQMNSHLENQKPAAAVADIEDILDGNICRCTGYRPIFDAFKSLATDCPKELADKLEKEPEELQGGFVCARKSASAAKKSTTTGKARFVKTEDGCRWWTPKDLNDLRVILQNLPTDSKYRLVAGNTATGVYANDGPYTNYIDVKKVPELQAVTKSFTLTMGSNVSLSQVIDTLDSMADEDPSNYAYGKQVVIHLKKVAHTSVRNIGSLAGNLMMKHIHREFPSDVFLNLEALGAMLVVMGTDGTVKEYLPSEWLDTSMDRKILYQVKFPRLNSSEYTYSSYKITPRRVNAHAYTNVATKIKTDNNFVVTEWPSIVCGGISNSTIHASKTEALLVSKSLKDPATLHEAMRSLAEEIFPDADEDWHADTSYRKHLVQACVYKSILQVLGDSVPKELRSGAERELPRGISKGSQSFKVNPDLWPMNKPIHKLEAKAQCTGTAEYIGDIPNQEYELHGAFVTAELGPSEIDTVDTTEALKLEGVVGFVDHRDVPGQNTYMHSMLHQVKEELFCSGKVFYAGQPVGLIVAETHDIALAAAKKVKVTYKNSGTKKPVVCIKEAILDQERVAQKAKMQIGKKPKDIAKTFDGEIEIGSQYHFYMETQSVLVKPIENSEFDVFSSTQWMSFVQEALSTVMALPYSKFNIQVRRLGGGFGGKFKNSGSMACAAAVAANKMNRPVRIILDLKSNMRMYGKRLPYFAKYNVGVTNKGLLQNLSIKMYCDTGFTHNEQTVADAAKFLQNGYACPSWDVEGFAVKTDTPSNTYTRAPGTTQGHNIMEIIMEHIADGLGMDPLELKRKNFLKKGDLLLAGDNDNPKYLEEENPLPAIITDITNSSNVTERKSAIAAFNKANKWRKRGLSVVPCKYELAYIPFMPYYCSLSIFAKDGTIIVTHGGIEMGQGINTKVAQTVAKTLGAPSVDLVTVKAANGNTTPDNCVSGGSSTSEMTCYAAMKASKVIREKLDSVQKALGNQVDWNTLIGAAFMNGVELTAVQGAHPKTDKMGSYFLWGAVVTEVEIDALTGEKNILRTDIVEDTGASISQAVDVGQIEGAFTFGLGLWTSEKISHDPTTGVLLTDDTWNYKPPTAYDIPEELNVKLVEGDKTKGLLGSKATGEPATHMGVSVALAIRNAVKAARTEVDPSSGWYNIVGPMTVEQIQRDTAVTASHFTLQ